MNSSVASLPPDVLCELSRLVISRLPAANPEDLIKAEEKAALADRLVFHSLVELNNHVEILFDYWRKALYHAQKPAVVRADFEQAGVPTEVAERIAALWLEEGARVMPKAKALSRSGKPDVVDIHWTLQLERATKDDPIKREPLVNLQFDTADGKERLHVELRQAQANLDSIFK
ncbi:COMM domain-containing protein [Aphelenchoides fujianensis]|nr:COMM domain-containing protein [Aphelenchoides fujianensis]